MQDSNDGLRGGYAGVLKCEKCDKTIPNHAWGKIKEGADWFFTRKGKAYCPDHFPEWVKSWRKK